MKFPQKPTGKNNDNDTLPRTVIITPEDLRGLPAKKGVSKGGTNVPPPPKNMTPLVP